MNSELVKRHEVENSPFTIIETEEGFTVTIGMFRLSEPYKSKEEAVEDADRVDWNRLIQVMSIVTKTQAIDMIEELTKTLKDKKDE